ncbi:MAG TPA: hypothetical protein PK433_03515 [Candidatus Cloacimonadota bacterium]|nr:hypothetical protein [Candidatus Cloacimonadota bacterium]HOR58607.1 hypothetical protein [Candidatus Cloacimonadota bacterium]
MAANDSTIPGLSTLSLPELLDLLLVCDTSASYEAKKMTLQSLVNLVYSSSPAFDINADRLRLKQALNANQKKISNLAGGDADQDAVAYSQVSPMIRTLNRLTPATPSISDKGSFLKILVSTINDPFGGFYLFYWCLDNSASTQLTVSGNTVVASSGTSVYFEGSVANVANLPKMEGMTGQYFHVAVRYRNFQNLSNISSTAHIRIETSIFEDLFVEKDPEPPADSSLTVIQNRLYINAVPSEENPPGTSYIAEILFNEQAKYAITGTEEGRLQISSSAPRFTYDLPLMCSKSLHVHVRIAAVTLSGTRAFTDTMSEQLSFDVNIVNDEFLAMMAARMAERIVTSNGEGLVVK